LAPPWPLLVAPRPPPFSLVYLIIAIRVRKTATIVVGMSEEFLDKRKKAAIGGWVLFGIGLFAFSAAYAHSLGLLMLLGGIALLGGLIWAAPGAKVVRPARIEGDYIWLKGVNKDYLAQFPDWSTR